MSAVRADRIVVVGGVFDGLHAGHLRLIRQAEALADAFDAQLCFLLNSDASLRALGRPTQHSEEQRKQLIEEILRRAFTQVTFFDEEHPRPALERLAQNAFIFFLKGHDTLDAGVRVPELGIEGVAYLYVTPVPNKGGFVKLSTRERS